MVSPENYVRASNDAEFNKIKKIARLNGQKFYNSPIYSMNFSLCAQKNPLSLKIGTTMQYLRQLFDDKEKSIKGSS